jgi:hypothetical protein
MDRAQMQYGEKMAEQVIDAIKDRRMAASYFVDGDRAKEAVLGKIPEGASIYRCGSCTLEEIGLLKALNDISSVEIIDPFEAGIEKEESLRRKNRGLSADIMITSTNSLTIDGKLVNIDGSGNRVAGMAFGPRKVFVVAGMNKVVSNVEAAMERIKRYAAPTNSMRLNLNNPCKETGCCTDCRSPSRICNIWSIIEGQMIKDRIEVILVGERLGY